MSNLEKEKTTGHGTKKLPVTGAKNTGGKGKNYQKTGKNYRVIGS